jgi:hypothetical protein
MENACEQRLAESKTSICCSPMNKENAVIPLERIESAILLMRGHRVMMDSDLALLYGVTVKRLNEQVRRNARRFPDDFMFQLTKEEAAAVDALRSQSATLKTGRGQHRKYLPFAFTEHGALMAANVLNSPQAENVSVLVIRAFIRLRQMLSTHKELARKLVELEDRLEGHDDALRTLVVAIRELAEPLKERKGRRMGFRPAKRKK